MQPKDIKVGMTIRYKPHCDCAKCKQESVNGLLTGVVNDTSIKGTDSDYVVVVFHLEYRTVPVKYIHFEHKKLEHIQRIKSGCVEV